VPLHLIDTAPDVHACRCGALVLGAVAEGVPVRADPHPLNLAGELAALASGRRSYVLSRVGLVLRDTSRLGLRGPVLADHRCGEAPDRDHLAPAALDVAPRQAAPTEPPF